MDKLAFVGLVGTVVGLLIQGLKTEKLQVFFQSAGLSVPARAWPWVAVVLGVTAGVCDAVVSGETTTDGVVTKVVTGLLAGGLPVLVHELGTNRE